MTEQSSTTFVAGLFALLLLAVPLATIGMPAASAATSAGIMVPLYTYPGSTWNTVVETKNAHPNLAIVAIVNPASGPGWSKDANYESGINKLQSAGVTVVGYVSTAYTNRAMSAVKSDIDRWASWYPGIDGIFFDEQTNWAGGEWYYTQAGDYAESKGLDFTIGNPGANSLPSYLDTVDVVLIYESPGLPNLSNYQNWAQYDNAKLGMIPFGVGSLPTQWIQNAVGIVGWLYVTNDVLPNPWDSLPPYFGNEASLLDNGTPTPTPTPTPTTPKYSLTVKSVDQNGNAVTGMWTEVKKNGATVSTGYTPLSLSLEQGTYAVSASNYQQIVFDHWSDGATSSTTSVSLSGNAELTAHYQNGPKQSPPSELTVQSVDMAGNAFSGMWTTVQSGSSMVKTGYTPLSYTAASGTYTVSVSDYQNNVFDHWEDGSKSRSRTVSMNGKPVALKAYYSTAPAAPKEVSLTVKSEDLKGNAINGMWTVVTKAGAAVKSGYTPLTFTAQAGSTYEVSVSNYKNNVFAQWDDGSTKSTRQVTASSDATLTAKYSTGSATPQDASLSVSSIDLGGNAFTGMWTVISKDGTVLKTGYTLISFRGQVGTEYTVSVSDYQNNVFDHWEDGSKSRSRTVVMPADGLSMAAYYKR